MVALTLNLCAVYVGMATDEGVKANREPTGVQSQGKHADTTE